MKVVQKIISLICFDHVSVFEGAINEVWGFKATLFVDTAQEMYEQIFILANFLR